MVDETILADQLVKRFGDLTAVDGVSLSVRRGTVLGLLGPNGAGKTTVVRMLTTILHPDAGRAFIEGVDVQADPAGVRSLLGLAGQYAAVDENLTGRENLIMVGRLTHQRRELHRPRAAELLAEFDLVDAADRPVKTYSGGMRRRLDLAAALVHRPPVLFLDEPTTGLDPKARQDLWRVIGSLVGSGTTVLLTTQYLEEADRLADRIAVVDHGHVIAEGTAKELKARLGSTIVSVTALDAGEVPALSDALARFGHVQTDGLTSDVSVADGGRAVLAVVRELDVRGIAVDHLAVREPSLDDVFLELTGHPPDPDPDPDAEAEADDPADGPAPRTGRHQEAAAT